jgi:hypothetical protein
LCVVLALAGWRDIRSWPSAAAAWNTVAEGAPLVIPTTPPRVEASRFANPSIAYN